MNSEIRHAGLVTEFHTPEGIGDLPPTDVGPDDVVRIPAGMRQRITNAGDADLLFYCVCSPRFLPEAYVASDR